VPLGSDRLYACATFYIAAVDLFALNTMSPGLTPIRDSLRRSYVRSHPGPRVSFWKSLAQCTAFTTRANSASTRSPEEHTNFCDAVGQGHQWPCALKKEAEMSPVHRPIRGGCSRTSRRRLSRRACVPPNPRHETDPAGAIAGRLYDISVEATPSTFAFRSIFANRYHG